MVNNAIDRSEGTRVTVAADLQRQDLFITVVDDGVGVFEKFAAALRLADLFASIQELSKGKRTSAPDRHTGEGIFFTSKAVDRFSIDANGLRWVTDNLRTNPAVEFMIRRGLASSGSRT